MSIPELRGFSPIPAGRTDKYSAASYAAQYGITVEEADELVGNYGSHPEIHGAILRMYSADPARRQRAIQWLELEEQANNRLIEERERKQKEKKAAKIAEAEKKEAEREKVAVAQQTTDEGERSAY